MKIKINIKRKEFKTLIDLLNSIDTLEESKTETNDKENKPTRKYTKKGDK